MASPLPKQAKITDRDYFEVPNRRVSYFVGREDVLQKIETGISSDAGPQVFVLRGLGGQGKTQIALEYCRRGVAHAFLRCSCGITNHGHLSLYVAYRLWEISD